MPVRVKKAKFENASKRRAIVSKSTSASEGEEPVQKQKKGTVRTPEVAFDLESEQRPNIREKSSGTTESESQQTGTSNKKQRIEQKAVEEPSPKIEHNPGNEQKTEKSARSGTKRVLERKLYPTKRYGIDVMQLEKEKNTEEL